MTKKTMKPKSNGDIRDIEERYRGNGRTPRHQGEGGRDDHIETLIPIREVRSNFHHFVARGV